jgi:hypothetical protein
VPEDDRINALIRAVCMDLCDPIENPSIESCDRGFLWSFREQMRGFHDSLRQKPSSLFRLLGWSSNHSPDDIHVSGFGGEDAGIMYLDVMYQDDTVLCHGRLVQMLLQP